MNNDKNALFGPDAIIPLDDVKVYEGLEKDFEQSYNIYVDSIGAIQIFVSSYHPTILEIGSIRTDTFILTTEVISHGECGCHGYDVTSVTRNGEVICTGDCEEIMEIEL